MMVLRASLGATGSKYVTLRGGLRRAIPFLLVRSGCSAQGPQFYASNTAKRSCSQIYARQKGGLWDSKVRIRSSGQATYPVDGAPRLRPLGDRVRAKKGPGRCERPRPSDRETEDCQHNRATISGQLTQCVKRGFRPRQGFMPRFRCHGRRGGTAGFVRARRSPLFIASSQAFCRSPPLFLPRGQ
jgi:hypothetical protein